MDKRFLNKFFKLYSKCSKKFAIYLGISDYCIVSYCKYKDVIYPYQYIDCTLLYCDEKKVVDNSQNSFLSEKFLIERTSFLLAFFPTDIVTLANINHKIQSNFKVDITVEDIYLLNEMYKSLIKNDN